MTSRRSAPGAKPRILCVEDHLMVFQGFRNSLRHRFEIEGPIVDGRKVIDAVAATLPDVIMLDLDLPGRHGTDILPELVVRFPDIPVLVVTVQNSPAVMEHVLRIGARGLVPKGADVRELSAAITDVLEGRVHRSPLVGSLPASRANHRHDEVIARLERPRRLVFELLGKGHTTSDVARLSGLSRWTVYYHRKMLRKMLRITSERGLDRAAIEWVIRQDAQRAAALDAAPAASRKPKRPKR